MGTGESLQHVREVHQRSTILSYDNGVRCYCCCLFAVIFHPFHSYYYYRCCLFTVSLELLHLLYVPLLYYSQCFEGQN